MKLPSKMLQNLPYFRSMKTAWFLFIFHIPKMWQIFNCFAIVYTVLLSNINLNTYMISVIS